jgi:hypothetical protein
MAGAAPVNPKVQFLTPAGVPLVGGFVFVYLAGTTTPSNTWQDKALTTLNQNPIELDSRGEAVVWLSPTLTYKFVLKDSLSVSQWTVDNISGNQSFELAAQLTAFEDSLAASGGSALVGYMQAGTGAIQRTAQSKLRERCTPQDFGALADGTTDDSDAVELALEYVSANNECLFVPAGEYRITRKITVAGTTNFSIKGEGQEVSQFVFEGGDVGFVLSAPARNATLGGASSLQGFSVLKNSDASTWGGTALKFTTGTVSGGNPSLTLSVDSVTVGGRRSDVSTANRFENGLHLVNCWQAQLSNIYLTGAIPLNTSTTNAGITWEDSTGSRAMNVHCYRFQTAYRVTGTTEGPSLINCVAVGVQDGVHVDAPDTSETNPGLDATSCHFNVSRYGIWADNRAQGIIKGCLFYERGDGAETIYKCVYMTGTSRQWVVMGNVMTAKVGTTPTTKIAIHFDGQDDNVIALNQIRASTFTRGIHIGSTVGNTSVVDNLMDAASDIQFINNSATPSTVRYRGGYAVGIPASTYGFATVSMATATATVLGMVTTGDTGNAASTLADDGAVVNARLIVPSYAKRVRISANVTWSASATGTRLMTIQKNGGNVRGLSQVRTNAASAGGNVTYLSSAPIDVVPGDYFTVSVTQTSGGSLDVTEGFASFLCLEVLA